jgi:hypothetical protein
MKRVLLVVALVLLLGVYFFGPAMVAQQSDVASTRCAERSGPEGTGEIDWRLVPVPGYVCVDSGDYLGWWLR